MFQQYWNGDNNEEEESSLVKDSDSKTPTMAEETKEELDSDKNPPASVSSRVIIIINFLSCFFFGRKLLELDLWKNCVW